VVTRDGGADANVTADGDRGWVVILEAAPAVEASLIDIGTVRAVLRAMGDEDGVALHAADRMAVQVRIDGGDVALALSAALARWERLARKCVPPGWDVVRAEVLTPDELQKEFERW
jgi:hypothetical protein